MREEDRNRLIGEAFDILTREGSLAVERVMKLTNYEGDPEDFDTEEPPEEGTEAYAWYVVANQIAKAQAKLSLAGVHDSTRARRADA